MDRFGKDKWSCDWLGGCSWETGGCPALSIICWKQQFNRGFISIEPISLPSKWWFGRRWGIWGNSLTKMPSYVAWYQCLFSPTFFLCAKRFVFLQTSKPIFAPGHPKDKCHGQNYFSIRIHMPIIGISTTEFMTIPHYSHVLIVADMSQNYTPVTYGPDSATLYQVCIPSGNLT